MHTSKVLREIEAGRMIEVQGAGVTRHNTDTGLLESSRFYVARDSRVVQLDTERRRIRCGTFAKTFKASEVKGSDLAQFQGKHPRYFRSARPLV